MGIVFFVGTISAQALQSRAIVSPSTTQDIVGSFPSVAFDVTILDDQYLPVSNISAQQLEVRESGKIVSQFDITPSGENPQSICLLVDASGSTFDDRDAIKRSVLKFLSELPPQDEVCLIDFAAEAYLDTALTFSRDKLRSDTQYIKPGGGSAVDDALLNTLTYLEKNARYASRAVILLSDGDDNASKVKPQELYHAINTLGAPVVYVVDNRKRAPYFNVDKRGRGHLATLGTETGGLVFFAAGDVDIDATVTSVVQVLSHRFRLVFNSQLPRDGKTHTLSIALSKDLQKVKMKLNAPRSFDAPRP